MANRIHVFDRKHFLGFFMKLQERLVNTSRLAIQFLQPVDNFIKRNLLHKKLFLLVFILATHTTNAWVYPEHRQIALLAIQHLSPENRALLDKLWSQARKGYEARLTTSVIDASQGTKPTQLDFGAWFGISGDHSCSPENMLYNVLQTDWILNVADIAAQLQVNIANSKNNTEHINAVRESDIKLQRADLEYATRAGSNNVHFLLARPEAKTTAREYLLACLNAGTELNALGAYAWFHTSAMLKADKYAKGNLTAEEKSALMLSALADEAFALHFLEDSYAAGHIAGTWGNAAVRKGTHDYYNERGLEIVTWDGKRQIVLGDSYMRHEDAEFAAAAVQLSLEQLLNVAGGKVPLDYEGTASPVSIPDTFNVCKGTVMPSPEAAMPTIKVNYKFLEDILITTPVPGLATGYGELPRFRTELGKFFGVSTALDLSDIFGGFGKQQTQNGFVGGIEANFRFGFGLDGVLNEAGDGLVFFQAGWKLDAASTNSFKNLDNSIPPVGLVSSVPSRSAYNVRLRLPFWLIPGDLLIAGPILFLISPKTLTQMAVVAGNGGLIPWQSGMTTSIGRFQFVLGREVGVSFYGTSGKTDIIVVPTAGAKSSLLEYKSTQFDFPILEYRPFRTFSLNQSSSLMIQLAGGFDIPHAASVLLPVGTPAPELRTLWHVGARIIFDWRRYF